MGSFFKKIGDIFMTPGAEDVEEYYEDEYGSDYDDDNGDFDERVPSHNDRQYIPKQPRQRDNNLYDIKDSPRASITKQPNSELVIVHPKSVSEAKEIARHLRSLRACIVDLTGVPIAEAQRIADFLSGVCEISDGSTTRVNNSIFTVSPKNYNVIATQGSNNSDDDSAYADADGY